MSEIIPNNGEQPAPPPELVQKRLESALHTAWILRPTDEGLETTLRKDLSFYLYADCQRAFLDEALYDPPVLGFARTEVDAATLQLSGTLMALYWVAKFPGEGIPQRYHLEGMFSQAGYSEAEVIRPLMQACAADIELDSPEATRLEQEWTRDISTFEGLENLYASHPDRLRMRHFTETLEPLAAQLGEQLQSAGHTPYDWDYFLQIRRR